MTTAIVRILFVLLLGGGVECLTYQLTLSFSFLLERIAQDTRAMAQILQVIRVRIICDNLQNAELIQ